MGIFWKYNCILLDGRGGGVYLKWFYSFFYDGGLGRGHARVVFACLHTVKENSITREVPCLRLLLHHIAAVQRRSLRRKGKEQFPPGSTILLHINKTRPTWKYPSSMLLLFLHEIVGRGLPLAPQLIIASSCGNNMLALLLPVPATEKMVALLLPVLVAIIWLHRGC